MLHHLLLQGDIPVNCYIIEHNKKCYIVDPGSDKQTLLRYVESKNLTVLGVLLTHAHADHIGAIDAFDVPVYLHKNEYQILIDNTNNGFTMFGRDVPFNIKDINIVQINESETFKIDDKTIEIILTPGHTPGGVCYKIDNDLCSGDTLFQGSVGRWDFPMGDIKSLKKSVVNLIDSLNDNVNVYPGHGPASTIANEKAINGFYKQWKLEL
ncbi:MAG: MBL fold metallo-hydrolase [Ichthyobacteriaceae bacterium]|nr:MBL fold metallo-hydrolase [Ichthyobacteriaceae bacterium]